MTRAAAPVLEARGLEKRFGATRALDGVDLQVTAGEILALIGPNGAGKSTCFNVINGQLRPDAGHVRLNGREITGLAPRRIWRLGVGRTFQVAATFGSMTAAENVQMALLSRARRLGALWPRAGRLFRDEALEALEALGIAALAEQRCGALAYGDVKQVELALALAHEPALLLMDEPTAGMAPAERARLMGRTVALARARAMAVLFTEHDMDTVFEHADRIVVLHRGAVIAQGTPEAVRADARVQEVYLGAAPARPARAAC